MSARCGRQWNRLAGSRTGSPVAVRREPSVDAHSALAIGEALRDLRERLVDLVAHLLAEDGEHDHGGDWAGALDRLGDARPFLLRHSGRRRRRNQSQVAAIDQATRTALLTSTATTPAVSSLTPVLSESVCARQQLPDGTVGIP